MVLLLFTKIAWWFDDKVNVAEFEADSGIGAVNADSGIGAVNEDSGIGAVNEDSGIEEVNEDSGIEEGDADSGVTGLDDDSGIWEFWLDSDLDVYSGIAVANKDSVKVGVDSEIVELGIR